MHQSDSGVGHLVRVSAGVMGMCVVGMVHTQGQGRLTSLDPETVETLGLDD